MRRQVLGFLALLLTAAPMSAAAGTRMLLVARDLDDRPLSGFHFAYGGVKSLATTDGATELDLPPDHPPGRQIKIQFVPTGKQIEEEWFLVDPQVNIPTGTEPAEVVLMRRSTFRQFAAEARDAPGQATIGSGETTTEDRKRALVETAAHYGLTEEQLETALRSFQETQDPKDRGIAAYLEGQFSQAEEFLNKAAEKKESDLVETLEYLGASQYGQAKYRTAADTFRKAVALRGEDSNLLSWLGRSLYRLAEWAEAEPLLRRALAIDEKSFGPDHPNVAIRLNNLAQLLKATNRLAEAEALMRRALVIDEKSLGAEHPVVSILLSNLALLLQATNRLIEAESLLRRALAINEKSFAPDHREVATNLHNLASLLQDTNRFAEAESLMRHAWAIDEKSFGPNHPNVATSLNNLAQLLQVTNRLDEAELLMRRVLAINENSLGAEHPMVAIALNNLALLLKATNRLGEAELLLHRALAIDKKSFGQNHPNVARDLNNLAMLLQDSNRIAEAEPLMRRQLVIFLDFSRHTGHEHPHLRAAIDNYAGLLEEMGKSQAEIETAIKALEER